jgi:acetyltransferase-like isoleucine patch superfamily enzyme
MALIDIATAGLLRAGEDVRIYELTRLTEPRQISFGDHVLVDDFVFLQGGAGLRIGSYVHIAAFASITGGGSASVGDFCGLSPGARILTGTELVDGSGLTNPTVPAEYRSVARSNTVLGDHAFLGANAVVLPGVQIGEGAVIGSCSMVREDIEPWTINVGSPTRVVGTRPSKVILAHALKLGFSG